MTRIVAGRWGSRRLDVPRTGVRPTSQRVREAVCNRLEHLCGGLGGLQVLDLFAGSGAVGLELLSRGAAAAVFVERDRAAVRAIRHNIAALSAEGATVVNRDAAAVARGDSLSADGCAFDIVFADPPYDMPLGALEAILADLVAGHRVRDGGMLLVEAAARSAGTPWPPGVLPIDSRDYGDTRVWYGRVSPEPSIGLGG